MAVRTLTFRVEIDIDDEASEREARDYVCVAVRSWGGQYHPDDPFFGLHDDAVRVVRYVRPARREKV